MATESSSSTRDTSALASRSTPTEAAGDGTPTQPPPQPPASQPDALALYSVALSTQDPEAQDKALEALYHSFQSHPGNLPILFPSIITLLGRAGIDGPLRGWIAKVLDLTFNRPTLNSNQRSLLASYTPDAILNFLQDPRQTFVVTAIQCFSTVYPHLFRQVCQDRSSPDKQRLWRTLESIKRTITQLYEQPPSPAANLGVKVACLKAFQRIVQVQTKSSSGQGQVSSQQAYANAAVRGADVNLSMVAPDHPVMAISQLEAEANRLLTIVVTLIFTSSIPDLIMPAMNSLSLLAKTRPTLNPIVLEALISWTPAALSDISHMQVRNVEKTLRLLYFHFHPQRNSLAAKHGSQVVEALDKQRARMEKANAQEQERAKAAKRKRGEDGSSGRKRVRFAADETESDQPEPKPAPPKPSPTKSAAPPTPPAPTPASVPPTPPSTVASAGANFTPAQTASAFARAALGSADALRSANTFDVTMLPVPVVVDLIIANLQALSAVELERAVQRVRSNLDLEATVGPPENPVAVSAAAPAPSGPAPPGGAAVKTEVESVAQSQSDRLGTGTELGEVAGPQDPLKMEVGDEELEIPEHLEAPAATEVRERDEPIDAPVEAAPDALAALQAFELAHPEPLGTKEADLIIHGCITRMCNLGEEDARLMRQQQAQTEDPDGAVAKKPPHPSRRHAQAVGLWSALVTRIATRGFLSPPPRPSEGDGPAEEVAAVAANGSADLVRQPRSGSTPDVLGAHADFVRQKLLAFVREDFTERSSLVAQWMAEEWLAEYRRGKAGRGATPLEVGSNPSSYDVWLSRVVDEVIPMVEGKSKSLAALLSEVPRLPEAVIRRMRDLCVDKTRMSQGFTILRDVAMYRPACRELACSILLGLTRHADRGIRGSAIITAKGWVGTNPNLEQRVLQFARQGLETLRSSAPGSLDEDEGRQSADGGSDSAEPNGADVNGAAQKSASGAEPAEPKKTEEMTEWELHSLRLVELLLALSVKALDLLDDLFLAYPGIPTEAQDALKKHIAPLVRSLGPNNAKLTHVLRHFPEGSDGLALSVFSILTEKNRNTNLSSIVKSLVAERDVDPRFLVPIMPDLTKADIIKNLPRVAMILNSRTPQDRQLVRSLFASIVTMPPQGFGSVSTNLPRVRQTELLSPVELMVLLHRSEKTIGIKTTVEAIRVCFGMTDIFTSEVLGAVLNQIVEEPDLPIVFMRTAIMAVSTYKSLSSYVSTTLFPRLITRKIWQTPLLWDGFILCAKQTAPSSFGALVQLPREQLRDVAARQPALREGLREHLTKKAGGNVARLRAFLELLGPEDGGGAGNPASVAATASDAAPSSDDGGGGGGARPNASAPATPEAAATSTAAAATATTSGAEVIAGATPTPTAGGVVTPGDGSADTSMQG